MDREHIHKKRIRKLSPFEWIYLSAAPHFPPFAIQLWIEAETLPTPTILAKALAKAAEVNPGARMVLQGRWWLDSLKAPQIRYLSRSDTPSLSHPLFHKAFAFDDKPPLEVVLWEGVGVIFRCSHVLMDASGLLFFAEETFRVLRGEPLLGTTTTDTDREYLLGFQHVMRRSWKLPDKLSPLGPPRVNEKGFVWDRRKITGPISAVGARLAASISNIAHRIIPNDTVRLMFPVNLRLLDSNLRSTCNFSNPFFFEIASNVDWPEYYARTLDAFANHEERSISSVDVILPRIPLPVLGALQRWMHDRQIRTNRYLLSGTVSYMGRFSLASFSSENFKPKSIFLLPFDTPGSAITIIGLEHENCLEIAASAPTATGSAGQLKALLDEICVELERGMVTHTTSSSNHLTYEPIEGPRSDLPKDLTVWDLFAQQVKKSPTKICISEGDRNLSYIELHRLSLAYALELRKIGVKSGDRVAILSGRTMVAIAALLGIMRIGAAFVPTDPEWPRERIDFVLSDCRPICLMIEEKFRKLTDFSPRILLSDLKDGIPDFNEIPPISSFEFPAYVLYTSGSTGRPKGVVVGQLSLLNYLAWGKEAYLKDLNSPAVFPLFTSLAFDLTLTSIFLPLIAGGEIQVFPNSNPLSSIRSIISDGRINIVKLTPSHLRIFWSTGIEKSSICKFIVGGEALQTKLAKEISEQAHHHVNIYNEYGPTEATVGCVAHRFEPEQDFGIFVPIGHPINNTEIILLDKNLNPVPDGQLGEICVSGDCLALGYLGRPDEEVRFIQRPYSTYSRIYRTGDLALRSVNGELEYRGRIDEQVKILGHRVEIGEIEAAIEASGFCQACAVISENYPAGLKLSAFVTWRDGPCEEELGTYMLRILPSYMIPSRIVGLDDIPLNENGKVDKTSLKRGESGVPQENDSTIDDLENVITSLILGTPVTSSASISLDKSLLELGIDSLQMMVLFTNISKRFLPASTHDLFFSELGDFFHNPTINNLVSLLRRLGAEKWRTSMRLIMF